MAANSNTSNPPVEKDKGPEDPTATDARITHLGSLFRKALEAASSGGRLTNDDRKKLRLWLNGDEWYTKRASRHTEEIKIERAQLMLLGSGLRRALDRACADGQLSIEDRDKLRHWLESARRAKRRYSHWLIGYGILGASGIFVLGLLIVALTKGAGLNDNPLTIPSIVAVVILVVALAKDVVFDRNVESALKDIRWISEKGKGDINDIIEKNLRPRIIPLDTREKVLRAASEILDEATRERDDRRFAVFIGAASLSTQKQESKAEGDDKRSPAEEYKDKLLALEHSKTVVERYIALITKEELPYRQEGLLRPYQAWLQKQIELLGTNANYTLYHCLRAQPYGGSRSSIITHKAFLDIIGDGDSGFLVKDEEVARSLKEGSERLFKFNPVKIRATYYGKNSDSIQSLTDQVSELKTELDSRKK